MSDQTVLYHFTCEHGHGALGEMGYLVPQIRHPQLGCLVTWLTTEREPNREASGLGMHVTTCDRMAYRYLVCEPIKARPWIGSPERNAAPVPVLLDLERYGDPEHWWVTSRPTLAMIDVSVLADTREGPDE